MTSRRAFIVDAVTSKPRKHRQMGNFPCPECNGKFSWCYLTIEIRGGCFGGDYDCSLRSPLAIPIPTTSAPAA